LSQSTSENRKKLLTKREEQWIQLTSAAKRNPLASQVCHKYHGHCHKLSYNHHYNHPATPLTATTPCPVQISINTVRFTHVKAVDGQMHGPVKMETSGGRGGVRRKSVLPYDQATVAALSEFKGHSLG
jgi:hypothetical protein